MEDSTNTQPNDFGPTWPVYPHLEQVVRVTSPPGLSGGGARIYPALTQQWAPPLTLRDREACFVFEPNNITLGPGYYDCRLVGSYQGLPLYATTCCVLAGFSSSSSSASPQSH